MGKHDVMQVCESGHKITGSASNTEFTSRFCKLCGAPTLTECSSCNYPIKGYYRVSGVFAADRSTPPSYCENCGQPFPWRSAEIENVRDILRMQLSEEDFTEAESVLPDVAGETPRSESAGMRMGVVLKKLQKPAYDVVIKVISDIASSAAKTGMGI